MVARDRKVGPTLSTPRVERRSRLSRSGRRVTAALWICAAALHIPATPAQSQTGAVCECASRRSDSDSPWWLALLPAGALGLLGLTPSSTVPAPVVTVPPAVVRPEYAVPTPLALPPAAVTPGPVVAPIAPGADTRIPVRKIVVPPPPRTSYNGPVPRFKVLRQLLGVPESAVAAARAREAETRRPAARPVSRKAAPASTAPAKPVAASAPASPRA